MSVQLTMASASVKATTTTTNNNNNSRRKVIVIPYVRSEGKLLMMVVKDKFHEEWTFISGGCKLYETSEQSAVRELKEETRAAVQLELAKTEYTKFKIETDYREPDEQQQGSWGPASKVITT